MTAVMASELHELLAIGQGAMDCSGLTELRRETMRLLQRVFRTSGVNFFMVLNPSPEQPWQLDRGMGHDLDPKSFDAYHRAYYPLDPFIPRLADTVGTGLCRAIPSQRMIDYTAFEGSAFYNEFYRPHGLHWAMGLSLVRNREPLAMIALFRPRTADPFSEEDAAKAELLGPFLSAALAKTAAADGVAERERVLDAVCPDLPYKGVLLLDDELRPVYVNRTASETLQRLGRHRAAGAACEDLPNEIILAARELQAARGPRAPTQASAAIPFAHGSRRLDVQIRSLELEGGGRRFLVCLGPEPPRVAAVDRLRALGLTPRQADIAQHVCYGLTNPQIATKLCLSVDTVNNHLKAIYEKLGVHNRTALSYRLTQSDNLDN